MADNIAVRLRNRFIPAITKQSNEKTKTKNEKIKFSYFGLRLKELFSQKTILFGIPFLIAINLLFGILYSYDVLNLNEYKSSTIYSLWLIAFSLINFVLITFAVRKLFHLDSNDGQIQLELRSGFSKRFMFCYRLLLIGCLIGIIVLTEISINSIFYAANWQKDSYYAYRFFISPFPWLVFISLLSLMLNLFFTVVVRMKMAIAFSLILGFICLIATSVGGNLVSLKVKRTWFLNTVMRNDRAMMADSGWISSGNVSPFTAQEYFALGFKYQNNFKLFEALKFYQGYDFLADDAFEKLNDFEFLSQYFFYQELVRIGDIYPTKTELNKIILELKNSGDSLLNAYAQFLTPEQTFNSAVTPNWLFFEFMNDIRNTWELFQDGSSKLSEGINFLNQWSNLNKKLNQAKNINPLYQINLIFFGYHPNFIEDNWVNFNRSIFAQVVNTKFTFNLKAVGTSDGEDEDTKYVLKDFKVQKNADVRWIFLGYGLGMLFLIGIMGFAYRVKR